MHCLYYIDNIIYIYIYRFSCRYPISHPQRNWAKISHNCGFTWLEIHQGSMGFFQFIDPQWIFGASHCHISWNRKPQKSFHAHQISWKSRGKSLKPQFFTMKIHHSSTKAHTLPPPGQDRSDRSRVVPLLGPASPASNLPRGWDDAQGWWKQLGISRIIFIYPSYIYIYIYIYLI